MTAEKEQQRHNRRLAKVPDQGLADNFVPTEGSALHMRFSSKNPALRVAPKS